MFRNLVVTILLLSLSPLNSAFAAHSKVLVGAHEVSDVELEGVSVAHRVPTLSKFFESSRPGTENENKLRRLLELAQSSWLKGNQDVARSKFRELTQMARAADWRDSQREAIFYAHLRLAQLADNSLEKEEWMISAARLYPDLEADIAVFAPPFVGIYSSVRSKILSAAVEVSSARVFPGYRFIYIDGRRFDLAKDEVIQVTEGTHRITAVSDKNQVFTESFTAAQLQIFRAEGQALVEGTCASAKLRKTLPFVDEVVAVFPDRCLAQLGRKENSSLDLKPSSNIEESWARVAQSPADARVEASRKRDWLWIGLGVLAAGAYFAHQESQKGTAPVHRTGF